MDDQIELLVEIYSYWRDRLDFCFEHTPARVAETQAEVDRLQQELARHGATFDTNGGIRWPSDEAV